MPNAVLALPWVGDEITGDERWALSGLSRIAVRDATLAQRVADLPWVGDGITEREYKAIQALGSADHGKVRTFLDRVGDDSSEEAILLLSVLFRLRHAGGGLLLDDMLQSHFTQSKTITLPLAGEVNLWAFQTARSPQGEDLTAMMEEAVRTTEEFMGTPFPLTDVVLVVPVIGAGKDHGIAGGAHWGDFIHVTRYQSQPFNRSAVHHEVGHYYFGFGTPWLVEGGAEFVSDYVWARTTGREYPEDRRSTAQDRVQKYCHNQGISTIQQLNAQQVQDSDILRFPTICHYGLGSYFLLRLYETLGEDVLSAALRELYLRYQGEPRPLTREEFAHYERAIYQAFLRNTPPELRDAFHDVYREIHGGPYAPG